MKLVLGSLITYRERTRELNESDAEREEKLETQVLEKH